MKNNDLINQLKVYPPDTPVHVFGSGAITKIEAGTDENGDSIRLVAQSKALDAMEAIRELKSETCRCGNDKKSGNSFCLDCYRKSPKAIQRALYNRVGDGYEQSYKLACDILENKK